MGFSLIEVMLVLAVLAILAAVVTPAAMRRLGDARMQSSAGEVIRLLTETRMMAMESGDSAEFRFEPLGSYCLANTRTDLENQQVGAGSSYSLSDALGKSAPPPPTTTNVFTRSLSVSGQLATGVAFVDKNNIHQDQPHSERVEQTWISNLTNAQELSELNWSRPILFRADGTTSDTEVEISDTAGRTIVIKVRGLTGSATALPMTVGAITTNSSPGALREP